MIRARITGTGSRLPEKILANFGMDKFVDTHNNWTVARIGVEEHRIAAERALEMAGVAVRPLTEVLIEAPAANDLSPSAISLFISHQTNKRILEATAKRLKLTDEQVYINDHKYGNTP